MPGPGGMDVVAVLRGRAAVLESAARGSVRPLGYPPLETSFDGSDPLEPSVWIRNDVLVVCRTDDILVSRVAPNMTDVEEIGRFPAEALIDAAVFAVVSSFARAVRTAVEDAVMAAGRAA